MAGDDVTSFVLDGGLSHFPGLDLRYVSLASSLAGGTGCSGARGAVGLLGTYEGLFGSACVENRDGNAILTDDALSVVAEAVSRAPTGPDGVPTHHGVFAGLQSSSLGGRGALEGASGRIDVTGRTSARHRPAVSLRAV